MQKVSEYVIDIRDVFEGPLDLLMHLIRVNEIDIHDIPISFILEEYQQYLKTLEQLDIDISSEFLVMVSTLLEIKSRMLLPTSYLDNMESDEEWLAALADPRRELVRSLMFNDIHRRLEEELREREDIQMRIFPSAQRTIIADYSADISIDLENIDLFDLLTAYQQMFVKENLPSFRFAMSKESLEAVLNELIHWRYGEDRKATFSEVVGSKIYPARLIIVFLAILEMVKMGILDVYQDSARGEISLEWK